MSPEASAAKVDEEAGGDIEMLLNPPGTSADLDNPLTQVYKEQAVLEVGSASAGDSAANRAKLYLTKKRDELAAMLRNLLGDKLSTYDAVRNHNLGSMVVPNLIGGIKINTTPVGDFISGGDGRLSKTVVHADFGAKINSSMSFDIRSMACICCPLKHTMSEGKRMAFILADQAFPAALPSETEKSCPFILRIENESIADLVSHFLDITNSCKIPPGSVSVASSATQMARCGTAPLRLSAS